MSRKINRLLVGDGKNDYIYPNEEMYKNLEELVGMPIFQSKALDMKVTLRLQNFNIYRRIIVPINFSFSDLHKTIQSAFNWQDYHLHEFYIFDSKNTNQPFSYNHPAYDGEGYKPILNLVCDEEAFNYGTGDIPMKMDTHVTLSEIMPAKVTYVYDFGDNWVHDIKIEGIIEDFDKNYPICLEGEGKTPPEDVGGEGGYENLLEILADKNHPDYEHMESWSSSLGYQDFDMDMVNRKLKNM